MKPFSEVLVDWLIAFKPDAFENPRTGQLYAIENARLEHTPGDDRVPCETVIIFDRVGTGSTGKTYRRRNCRVTVPGDVTFFAEQLVHVAQGGTWANWAVQVVDNLLY